ncbi:uncharacterized protein LOC106028986 isoform X2 [Cavia porcellus]|uniref:uncharacterized protein LOC106028986 isoform X2 n=1 Tax=Cavia porcellus TaxID=10141 RepID=UPI002FE2AA26
MRRGSSPGESWFSLRSQRKSRREAWAWMSPLQKRPTHGAGFQEQALKTEERYKWELFVWILSRLLTRSCYVLQAGLELPAVFLPQPPSAEITELIYTSSKSRGEPVSVSKSDICAFTSEVVLAKTPGTSVYLGINLHPVDSPRLQYSALCQQEVVKERNLRPFS